MTRVQVPLEEEQKEAVERHPEAFGLDPGLPKAQVHARVYQAGFAALRQQQHRQAQLEAYERMASDPEELAATEALTALAYEDFL